MSASAGMLPSALHTAGRVPGHVRVAERVIDKVAREVSARAIGVQRDEVTVDVMEWGGSLAVRVAARLPIPDLTDDEAVRSAPRIVDRVRDLQLTVARDLSRLSGRDVRRVSFRVTGAILPERKRVR